MRRYLRFLFPLVILLLLVLAIWGLNRELEEVRFHDVLRAIRQIPLTHLIFAFIFTFLSYASLSAYDFLGLHYVKEHLPIPKVLFTSFVSYSMSNNIGLASLGGSAIRYRLYFASNVPGLSIARLIMFTGIMFWTGLCFVGGLTSILHPVMVPHALHIVFESSFPLGLLLLALLAAYLTVTLVNKRPLHLGKWEIELPSFREALLQILFASLDLMLTAMVLFILLPSGSGISYITLLGIFTFGIIAGIISNVPGGIGVFELVVLALMPAEIPRASLLSTLIIYRLAYYLVPLAISILLLGIYEIQRSRERIRPAFRSVQNLLTMFIPRLLSVLIFSAGVILLLSGATPNLPHRLEILRDILPLPMIELSHFLGSLLGVALLFLAFGIRQRLDASYVLSLILLALGVAASLLKGLDYEEAAFLGVSLLLLLPSHKYFYRKSALSSFWLSRTSFLAIATALIGSIWLGFFAYRHVEYSTELWWKFEFEGDVSRFLRATVGAAVLLVSLSLARLLRPSRPKMSLSVPSDLEAVTRIITSPECDSTIAWLAFLGDKQFLFSQSRNSFLMYAISGRSWITMGDPIGDREEAQELILEFRRQCERAGAWSVFYETKEENLGVYIDQGLTLMKIGEDAIVDLDRFSIEGGARKTLRYTIRHLEQKDGAHFEIFPPDQVRARMRELQEISDSWLKEKHTREKRFSLGYFNEDYLSLFPIATVMIQNRIVAFANVWISGSREELSVDLMRYGKEAPHSTMDYLFMKLLLWGKEQGFRRFNLGLAPLAGFVNTPTSSLWQQTGHLLYKYGEYFYNFRGLHDYKKKFDPLWKPRYIAGPSGFAVPQVVINLASLISGGITGIIGE